MKSTVSKRAGIVTLVFTILATHLFPPAFAQSLVAELKQKASECRSARNECFKTCYVPSQQLEVGQEVAEAEIEACYIAYAEFKSAQGGTVPQPAWTPEYAPMPDVIGVFRGVVIQAQDRDDWKRYCRSTAVVGEPAETTSIIPKGATVRVSGIQYVTNPVKSFDRTKNACRAESVEVVALP